MKRRDILRRILAAGLCLCMCFGFVEAALPVWADAPDSVDSVPAADVPAADVPSDVPAADVPTDVPATDTPSDVPATDMPSDAPATEPPVEEPANDEPDAEPAPDGPVVDVPSASLEPTDEPSESPEPVEKTVFTVIRHYPEPEADEADVMEEAPEAQEDTPVEPLPADAWPEEAQETDPPTGEIMPDGTVYVYETGETSAAPYIVRPEPELDEDGNVVATFAGFVVEEGDAAVAIEPEDPEDPATICAKISYEPATPQVTLHVYYEDNGIATIGGIDPSETNAEAVKKYFVDNNLTGIYATKRQEEGQSYDRWSIEITNDETFIALLYDGKDTGAKAKFSSVTSGKPGSIVFSREGWFKDKDSEETKQLTFKFDATSNYFTISKDTLYWDKDGDEARETYSFSDACHYYNENILKAYFTAFPGEYTLSDGTGWTVTVGEDGGMTMSSTDGKANNAFVDYMTRNTNGTCQGGLLYKSRLVQH